MAKETTAIANWDQELADAAKAAAEQEAGVGGGQFFSIRSGLLTLGGEEVPGNEMACVVLDSVNENVLYEGDYDPEVGSAPVCYAFGRDDKTIAPHADAPQKCAATCSDCPNNVFGTADKGRGKKCKNRRRLAVIAAGTLRNGAFEPFVKPEQFDGQQIAFIGLPPTAIKGWAQHVKRIAGTLNRPPWAVFTKISVKRDAKTQVAIKFDLLDLAPAALASVLIRRNKEATEQIIFPYPKAEAAAEKPTGKAKRRKF
jgi:hypothetical protein